MFISMKFNTTKKLVEFIAETIDEVDVFAYYLGISNSDIHWCLANKNRKIKNPLRSDTNPSLGFMKTSSGKIRMKDFAEENYNGDIFDLIALLEFKDVRNPKHFVEIGTDIINKFYHNSPTKAKLTRNLSADPLVAPKTIDIIKRDWIGWDYMFWKHLPKEQIHRDIIPIDALIINGILKYRFSGRYPGYAYYFGKKDGIKTYKVYFPYTDGNGRKFVTNNKGKFDGRSVDFQETDSLIITKSVKDKLYIRSAIAIAIPSSIGVSSVTSFSSESVYLNKKQANRLTSFYPKVYLNCDYDYAGLCCMYYHKVCYNFEVFTLGRDRRFVKYDQKSITSFINRVRYESKIADVSVEDFENFIDNMSGSYIDKDVSDYIKTNGMINGNRTLLKLIHDWT